jgi:hypothetical protein
MYECVLRCIGVHCTMGYIVIHYITFGLHGRAFGQMYEFVLRCRVVEYISGREYISGHLYRIRYYHNNPHTLRVDRRPEKSANLPDFSGAGRPRVSEFYPI